MVNTNLHQFTHLKKKYITTLNCKQNDKNILLLISMSINTTKENNYKKSC